MKVKDLINKLQEFNLELPVCVADWREPYRFPKEKAAEGVELVVNGMYWSVDGSFRGDYVCLGLGDGLE